MADAPAGFREVSDAPEGFRAVVEQRAPAASATPYSDTHSPLVGGILDTLGLTNRPGARTPVDVVLNPEGLAEHGASLAVTAPLIAAGGGVGAAAKVPAALGRITTAAGLGAASAANTGDDIGWGALIDGAVAGIAEGVAKGVTALPKVGLKALGAPQRGFEWATEAPAKALEFVRSRLPAGKWLIVPSLSNAKLTADEAIERLSKTTGDLYQVVRAEIADNLNRLDIQKLTGPKPLAGSVFRKQTSPERFEPKTTAKIAEGTRRALDSGAGRAALDAAATLPIEGIPAGAYPLAMGPETFSRFARRFVPLP